MPKEPLVTAGEADPMPVSACEDLLALIARLLARRWLRTDNKEPKAKSRRRKARKFDSSVDGR
jgi:hypothetical protein